MKKEKLEYVILFLTVFLLIPFISSQTNFGQIFGGAGGLEWLINGVKEAFAQIFGPILGHDVVDEFMFAKVLLFFLIFSIVYIVLDRVPLFEGNKAVHVVVTIIVAILSVRYLQPNEIITAILLPYGGLGGAITVILPLFIFFYFIHSSMDTGFGRRFAWAIYGIILLIIWGSREYSDMQVSGNLIYLLALLFVVISFIRDDSLHRYFANAPIRDAAEEIRARAIQDLLEQLRLAGQSGSHSRVEKIKRDLRRRYGVRV